MDPAIRFFFFLLPLFFFLPHQATAEEISRACESAVDKHLCIKSLQSVPGSKTANLSGLAEMAINLTIQNGTAITEHIKKLVANTTDAFDNQCLKDCLHLYNASVLFELEKAFEAFKSKEYSDIALWIRQAMLDSHACDSWFDRKPVNSSMIHTSMFKDRYVLFQQLLDNALAIVNVLPHQASTEEISRACESAVYKHLCIKTLESIPGSQTANLSGLADMAINLLIQNATAITQHIRKLMANTTDEYDKHDLKFSLDIYKNYVLYRLEELSESFKLKEYSETAQYLEVALSDTSAGDKWFEPGHTSKIKDVHILFQQLLGNALSIIKVLGGL